MNVRKNFVFQQAMSITSWAKTKNRGSRHVARVLERGLHFAGGLGELPQKNFKFKVGEYPKI